MSRVISFALLIAALGPGCAASTDGAAASAAADGNPCGLRAAMDPRQPRALRDAPPACALPTVEDVASSCAARDFVTSPDYRPPAHDEDGQPISSQRLPEYQVRELHCGFTSRARNKADCRFTLEFAEGRAGDREVTFEHRFIMDIGPAHDFYGTQWMPTSRCAPFPDSKAA